MIFDALKSIIPNNLKTIKYLYLNLFITLFCGAKNISPHLSTKNYHL